jgi:hypothetical protein
MLLARPAHRAFALNPLTRLQAETRPAGPWNAMRIAAKPAARRLSGLASAAAAKRKSQTGQKLPCLPR